MVRPIRVRMLLLHVLLVFFIATLDSLTDFLTSIREPVVVVGDNIEFPTYLHETTYSISYIHSVLRFRYCWNIRR